MSQREYNEIYHGPLIEFLRMDAPRQQAFMNMATPSTKAALKNAIKRSVKGGVA